MTEDAKILDNDGDLSKSAPDENGAIQVNLDEARSSGVEYDLLVQRRDQRKWIFRFSLGFAVVFFLAWIGVLIHCFIYNHEYIKELLTASRLVMLIFTLPLLAIITLMWFLMHYIYGPQSAKQTQINGPYSEMLDAINKSLDTIKSFLSCLPFINK